jgi:hypothetical protein
MLRASEAGGAFTSRVAKPGLGFMLGDFAKNTTKHCRRKDLTFPKESCDRRIRAVGWFLVVWLMCAWGCWVCVASVRWCGVWCVRGGVCVFLLPLEPEEIFPASSRLGFAGG